MADSLLPGLNTTESLKEVGVVEGDDEGYRHRHCVAISGALSVCLGRVKMRGDSAHCLKVGQASMIAVMHTLVVWR